MAWRPGLVVKAEDIQLRVVNSLPQPQAGTKILEGCYVDYFTRHNPPATLEWHVLHSRWVREVKKGNIFK